jgi:hypothetical protein
MNEWFKEQDKTQRLEGDVVERWALQNIIICSSNSPFSSIVAGGVLPSMELEFPPGGGGVNEGKIKTNKFPPPVIL